ncbi:hypothetical protein [Microbulbifer guangxiensis]|uniref:hypothetical protein n=1 Tax=Microbulbifer guangxiensis TaxID=2904249 RepID=UPI001F214758|nr:hypothetical protein [Microbulbifer guangxiensis]
MKIFLSLGSLILLWAASTVAQERYVCTLGNTERTIEVIQVNPPAGLPCEVRYTKPSGTQTLWRSQYQAGFCEDRAREFAEKQVGWGWQCNRAQARDPAAGEVLPETDLQ